MYDNNKYFKTGIYAYLNSTASPQNSGWLRDPKIQPSIINKKFLNEVLVLPSSKVGI